jgi:hypothetical protein
MKDANTWQKHAGRARQYMGFDEAGEFLVQQVASLARVAAWQARAALSHGAREQPSTHRGGRLDASSGSRPGSSTSIRSRRRPGELRWAFMDPERIVPDMGEMGRTREAEDNQDDQAAVASPSFRRSSSDNPHNDTPEYRARLNALPEPLRSQLKQGIFALSASRTMSGR